MEEKAVQNNFSENSENIFKLEHTLVVWLFVSVFTIIMFFSIISNAWYVLKHYPFIMLGKIAFLFFVWHLACRFPGGAKDIIVNNDKIIFRGKREKVLVTIDILERVEFSSRLKNVIIIEGLDKDGKRIKKKIYKKYLNEEKYSKIKEILKLE